MNVIVLGCGPAGLMAAHGATLAGATVRVISKRRKSEMFGAQYLHEPIPGVPCGEPVRVQYKLTGTPIEYRLKVYGDKWDGTVSPEDLASDHDAWNIRDAYDWLWREYSGIIHDGMVVPALMTTFLESADLVISTIPKDLLCVQGHTFGSADIYAAGDAPERGISIPYTCDDNTVICNGEPAPSWYRLSRIFGMSTVEWPGSMRMAPPVPTAATVRKPTFNNCDCWATAVFAGRYGRWEKGVLSHTAFYDAANAVERAVEIGA